VLGWTIQPSWTNGGRIGMLPLPIRLRNEGGTNIVSTTVSRGCLEMGERMARVKYLNVKVRYFLKLCKNNEEQFFYPIRPPGSLTELAPMKPSKRGGMLAAVIPGGWSLFIY